MRLGIDIGGTFTDFALVDGEGHRVAVHKRLTTPREPDRAVLDGAAAICAEAGCAPGDIVEIVHGTTLVTNALIERRGDRTGMLVTEGFRDLFDIGREQRYDLFDLRLRYAEPIVERALRAEIPERLRHDGAVLVPLDQEAVAAAVRRLVGEERIEALAICFLHAHADDRHERRAAEIAQEIHPGLHVSCSAEVFPYPREFERWTTACANAYSRPLVERYLARLEEGLSALGFRGRLAIMDSAGGLMSLDMARRYPVRLLESGPAAGILVAARIGRTHGAADLLSFDLGGTTAKGALVRKGRALRAYTFEAAHVYEHRAGSGLELRIPVLDMTEIGTGGGSFAELDELGRLRVGPHSAGADPGPVCYGRGGTAPTLTDANLLLGYLHAESFLGGTMRLDREAAEAAYRDGPGATLGVDATRAAFGVHDLANETIARAFRMHATERGFDYRGSAMVALGGGGPLHAARIARKLRVPMVIFPVGAGVLSAFGMLSGAPAFEAVRAYPRDLAAVCDSDLTAVLAELDAEASAPLLAGGIAAGVITLNRRADVRYRGQHYDIEVEVPEPGEGLAHALRSRFAERYRAIFHTNLDEPVEIVGWKVEASAPEPKHLSTAPAHRGGADSVIRKGSPSHPHAEVLGEAEPRSTHRRCASFEAGLRPAPQDEEVGSFRSGSEAARHRPAYVPFLGGFVDCPVHARSALAPGDEIVGPALIEEAESTTLLDAGDRAVVQPDLTLVAQIAVA